jgi:hypothetical protein
LPPLPPEKNPNLKKNSFKANPLKVLKEKNLTDCGCRERKAAKSGYGRPEGFSPFPFRKKSAARKKQPIKNRLLFLYFYFVILSAIDDATNDSGLTTQSKPQDLIHPDISGITFLVGPLYPAST